MAIAKDKPEALDAAIADCYKKFDVHVGSFASIAPGAKALSTGNMAIDYITGIGGLPIGRTIELYGPASCGKSSMATMVAAGLQKTIIENGSGESILYMDYEQSMDRKYCEALGLDVDHNSFLLAQPDSLEQGMNVARRLISTGKIPLVIWDSVAAMTPMARYDNDTGKAIPGIQARLMSESLQVLTSLVAKYDCCAIFLNHIMDLFDMGGPARPGMKRTSTPGGRALKFYASMRMEFQQIGNSKGNVMDSMLNEETVQIEATDVRIRVIKNKVGPAFKQATVRVRFGRGFDNFWSALNILVAHKKVAHIPGYYYFDKMIELSHPDMSIGTTSSKRPYIHGDADVIKFADEHLEWRSLIIKTAENVLFSAHPTSGDIQLETRVIEESTPSEDDAKELEEQETLA